MSAIPETMRAIRDEILDPGQEATAEKVEAGVNTARAWLDRHYGQSGGSPRTVGFSPTGGADPRARGTSATIRRIAFYSWM